MGLLWYYRSIYWQFPEASAVTALRRSFIKAAEETLLFYCLLKNEMSPAITRSYLFVKFQSIRFLKAPRTFFFCFFLLTEMLPSLGDGAP